MQVYDGMKHEVFNGRMFDTRSGSIRLKEVVDGPQDVVYIPGSLIEWFKENRKESGWVFESDREGGKPVKNLWDVLAAASKVCGCHLATHSFRHASATYLYEQNRNIDYVVNTK